MEAVYDFVRYLNIAAFVLLALVTYRQWRTRHDESAKWALLTFLTLGTVAVVGLALPEHSDDRLVDYVRKVTIAALLLFPYFLYRIATSFEHKKTWFDNAALAATAAVIVWTFFLSRIPEEGEPQSTAFSEFVAAIVVLWVVLSGVVAYKFWRAGDGQPSVARKRMRMLSGASLALSLAIVIAGGAGSDQSTGTQIVTQTIALGSVLAFFLAFAPPRVLRSTWRRPVEESLRRASVDLMTAASSDEVMGVLLPYAIEIVGGEGIAVTDADGKLLGAHRMSDSALAGGEQLRSAGATTDPAVPGLVHLRFPFGSIVVQTGPYTAFFGRDEIDLLGALGALANLALERVSAGDLRLQLAQAQLRRRQALEINDNIVQGLAVAKYSFEVGQEDKARAAVEGTLVAARAIISELVEEIDEDISFGHAALTRDQPATAFMDREGE